MRYTEQNYPLLRFLKWSDNLMRHPEFLKSHKAAQKAKGNGDLPFLNFQKMEIYEGAANRSPLGFDIREAIFRAWPELHTAFMKKIEIISKNFFFAMEKSYDAFLNVELFQEVIGKFQGTVVLPNGEAMCYDFEMAYPSWDENHRLRYGIAGNALRIDEDGNKLILAVIGEQAYDAVTAKAISRATEEAEGIFDFIIVYHLFKKYAQVQTVDAKSLKRTDAEQPELKTTINGIQYLDASWYTTIVRNEGFGVRGHFRLQPCGEGRKDKKLIYINEYRKHGYVRKARLLTNKD